MTRKKGGRERKRECDVERLILRYQWTVTINRRDLYKVNY